MPGLNTFLLVLVAILPVVNPPGSALIFLGLTQGATAEIRHILAGRVVVNSFIVLVCSLLLGALILQFYGISIPILRVAGGFIVAVAGWKLLNEGSHKYKEASAGDSSQTEILNLAFYPLTLPLTTGPGTIAVVISLGLSRGSSTDLADEIIFVIACLLAVAAIALIIFFCFRYAEHIQRLLGQGGTDIAVRLFPFVLFLSRRSDSMVWRKRALEVCNLSGAPGRGFRQGGVGRGRTISSIRKLNHARPAQRN